MSETWTLPVVPLRNAVVFPGVGIPIGVGRPSTLKAVESALTRNAEKGQPEALVFAVAQRSPGEEVAPDQLHRIGTVSSLAQVQRGLTGVRLVLQGRRRGIATRISENNGLFEANVQSVEEMAPLDARDPAFMALHREARERAAELGRKLGLPEEVLQQILAEVEEPGKLADLVAGYLEIPVTEKQKLLEAFSVEERVRQVLIHVQRQISVLEAQQDLKSKVEEEIGGRQREMFLREQMKAIQKELGEGAEGAAAEDLKELREKLDALELPEGVRKDIEREWSRLTRMARESLEAQLIRNYLEYVVELPWSARTEEHLDVAEAARVLEEDHYGLKEVKDRVLEFLAVRQLGAATQGKPHGRILLFTGPPGVGKTSIAKSIARAMGRKYVRISLGGARDEADIRGHRRTYVGALPGRILQGMKQAGARNPVFLLDEVDKLGVSFQGDPASALLEVLDPAQNDSFTDHYLGVPFDLSEVLFIATANLLQYIPAPLADRMEIVEFTGYTEQEKLEIARRYLVPRQLGQNGLRPGDLEIADSAIAAVITGYTRESGVRQLERELGRLARKVARLIAQGEAEKKTLGAADVAGLLGRPKVRPERMAASDQVGVATGMYYAPTGGDIMFVESTVMRGKGEVVLTGQLGDVMKESARAAWSYARSHALALQIPEDSFDRDLHIHVPAGAIPKDGPSAGITIATALVSALSGRPVRNDVAMTGEITLSGRVLPIGGLKEKILGAVRAGITRFVIPRENEPDLSDLTPEVRSSIETYLVQDLGEALALTLRGASFQGGRLSFPAEGAATPPANPGPH
jgi:ATP-dependent Lon protease